MRDLQELTAAWLEHADKTALAEAIVLARRQFEADRSLDHRIT
jgi:hypothetical protein